MPHVHIQRNIDIFPTPCCKHFTVCKIIIIVISTIVMGNVVIAIITSTSSTLAELQCLSQGSFDLDACGFRFKPYEIYSMTFAHPPHAPISFSFVVVVLLLCVCVCCHFVML